MNRYQSYKPSGVEWIGEIPESWELKPLYSECYQTKLKNDDNSLPILSLSYGKIKIRDIESNQGLLPESFDNYQKIKKGFIVLRLTDLQNDKTSLRVGYSEINGLITPVYISIGCNENVFNKYLFYQLYDSDIRKVLYSLGGGLRQTLRYVELSRYPILIPPILEQHQIVQFLDEKTELIDKLISTKERKITLLKEQRTSLINQVVTKGLNPNVKMKDSGVEWIGEIPEQWLLISLHKLLQTNRLEFQDGNHGGEHPDPDEFINNGVPFIKPRDIQDGNVNWSSCDRLPFERCSRFRIGFSNNDDVLLVNRGGSIGKVCYISDYDNEFPYFVINPQVTYLRGKNGLSSKYVFYITKSDVFRCGVDLVLGHGSTFPFLGLSNMGNFQMVLPPQVEQEEIVKYLDNSTKEIDDLVQLEQKKIDLLKEYRQSLISEVVTGKIKVTN